MKEQEFIEYFKDSDNKGELVQSLFNSCKDDWPSLLSNLQIDNQMTSKFTLAQIFKDREFVIPLYQRGFVWQGKSQSNIKPTTFELDDFYNDLLRAEETKREHYMGFLALQKENNIFNVVDGQQRLASAAILIKLLITRLNKSDTPPNFTFSFGSNSSSSIDKILGGAPQTENIKKAIKESQNNCDLFRLRLVQAIEFFYEKVQECKDTTFLESLYNTLLNKLTFCIIFDDDANVSIMFETINNRGKALSKLEILKNRTFYHLDLNRGSIDYDKESDNLNKHWQKIFTNLGKASFHKIDQDISEKAVDFMRAWWMIESRNTYSKRPKAQIKKALEAFSLGEKMDYEVLNSHIISLENFSEKWALFKNPDKDTDPLNQILDRLNKLTNDVYACAAITALLMALGSESTDLTDGNTIQKVPNLIELLKLLERFIFACSITSTSRDYSFLISPVCDVLKAQNDSDMTKAVHALVDLLINASGKGLKDLLSEKNIAEVFSRQQDEGFYKWAKLPYILYALNESKKDAGNSSQTIAYERLESDTSNSIEHVYPQTPDTKFKDYWDQCITPSELDISQYLDLSKVTNSLGNLLPLKISNNIRVKNYIYPIKRHIGTYRSDCRLASDFYGDYPAHFNIIDISQRTKDIFGFIKDNLLNYNLTIFGNTYSSNFAYSDALDAVRDFRKEEYKTDPAATTAQKTLCALARTSPIYKKINAELDNIVENSKYFIQDMAKYITLQKRVTKHKKFLLFVYPSQENEEKRPPEELNVTDPIRAFIDALKPQAESKGFKLVVARIEKYGSDFGKIFENINEVLETFIRANEKFSSSEVVLLATNHESLAENICVQTSTRKTILLDLDPSLSKNVIALNGKPALNDYIPDIVDKL